MNASFEKESSSKLHLMYSLENLRTSEEKEIHFLHKCHVKSTVNFGLVSLVGIINFEKHFFIF